MSHRTNPLRLQFCLPLLALTEMIGEIFKGTDFPKGSLKALMREKKLTIFNVNSEGLSYCTLTLMYMI